MLTDAAGTVDTTHSNTTDGVPVWSPDGTKIAFEGFPDGDWEVYVMNADGSDLRNLTNNPAQHLRLAWSPDGSKIAFDTDRDGNQDVYVMNVDGTGLVNLTHNPAS